MLPQAIFLEGSPAVAANWLGTESRVTKIVIGFEEQAAFDFVASCTLDSLHQLSLILNATHDHMAARGTSEPRTRFLSRVRCLDYLIAERDVLPDKHINIRDLGVIHCFFLNGDDSINH